MRFKLGLALGFAAGYWYGSLPEEERKKQLDEALARVKENPRLQRVTDTVSRNTTKVTDAIEGKVVDTADRAGDVVASKVPSGSSTSTSTSTTSPPATPSSKTSSVSKSSSTSKGSSTSSGDDDAETLEKLPGTGIG
jgi:hypothetical protein